MDFTNILEVLPTLTDCQMEVISDHMEEIQRLRKAEKREKAINNFKEAFSVLRKAGVDIFVEYENEFYYDDVHIDNVDQFNFS